MRYIKPSEPTQIEVDIHGNPLKRPRGVKVNWSTLPGAVVPGFASNGVGGGHLEQDLCVALCVAPTVIA